MKSSYCSIAVSVSCSIFIGDVTKIKIRYISTATGTAHKRCLLS